MRRIVFVFGVVIVSVLFLEAAYFSYVLTQENSDVRSDAILVFMGAEKRIDTGYRLANQGLAPGIVLSPANDELRRHCDRKYALKDTVFHIPEEEANTTFENAFYTSRIIKRHRYKTVILVTSDYHMSRSLALLRLFLVGEEVRIHPHMVRRAKEAANATLVKLVYNEMVEFWGSLYEYVSYQVTGTLSEKPVKKSGIVIYLKSLVLLKVNPSW